MRFAPCKEKKVKLRAAVRTREVMGASPIRSAYRHPRRDAYTALHLASLFTQDRTLSLRRVTEGNRRVERERT